MKLYLATNNVHKKKEMAAIFSPHLVVIPADEGIAFDPEETGASFAENSLIKAKALWSVVRCPVLADDSGICVDALDGRPGIYSARYAGGAPNQNELLLAETDRVIALRRSTGRGLPAGDKTTAGSERACRFVCAMTLYVGEERFFIAQETLEGCLVDNIAQAGGEGGFGYDPVFFLDEYGKTVAELSDAEKNTVSHRARAAAVIKRFLADFIVDIS